MMDLEFSMKYNTNNIYAYEKTINFSSNVPVLHGNFVCSALWVSIIIKLKTQNYYYEEKIF